MQCKQHAVSRLIECGMTMRFFLPIDVVPQMDARTVFCTHLGLLDAVHFLVLVVLCINIDRCEW